MICNSVILFYQFVVGIVFLGAASSSPNVTIEQGTLIGRTYTTAYGRYYSFQGIPYAKPPVGDLRFKAPVPVDPSTDTFNATSEGPRCMQMDSGKGEIIGDEDCLYLNVYTRLTQLPDPEEKHPVMVWIHGGSFSSGTGNIQGLRPSFILNRNIIYVGINYRLSILGFLSTQDEAVPGNMGMKDQALALKWVKNNIAAFGGDPDRITIFGESAGGAAVSLHVVSPMSKDLFHNAIAQCGSSANPWALRESDIARNTAFHMGNVLGYTGESSQELVDFLRDVPAEDLIEAAYNNVTQFDEHRIALMNFPPVVEPAVEGEESFLPESPLNFLIEGRFNDVTLLTGTNSGGSLNFLANKGMLDGTISPEWIEENFLKIVKSDLRYCKTEPCGDDMVAKIKSFYFGNESISDTNLQVLVDMATDLLFSEGMAYAVDRIASVGSKPVYLYEFNYLGGLTTKGKFPGASNFSGVPHGDELVYLFDDGREFISQSDTNMRRRIPTMWTTFAKTGNPTPENSDDIPVWPAYTSADKHYLEIDSELTVKTELKKERMDFWEELYTSSSYK